MTFNEFTERANANGLTARRCSHFHWQLVGGAKVVSVWAHTRRGFRYSVAGGKAKDGSLDDAISAAWPRARPEAPANRETRDGDPVARTPGVDDETRVGLIRWLWRLIW